MFKPAKKYPFGSKEYIVQNLRILTVYSIALILPPCCICVYSGSSIFDVFNLEKVRRNVVEVEEQRKKEKFDLVREKVLKAEQQAEEFKLPSWPPQFKK